MRTGIGQGDDFVTRLTSKIIPYLEAWYRSCGCRVRSTDTSSTRTIRPWTRSVPSSRRYAVIRGPSGAFGRLTAFVPLGLVEVIRRLRLKN